MSHHRTQFRLGLPASSSRRWVAAGLGALAVAAAAWLVLPFGDPQSADRADLATGSGQGDTTGATGSGADPATVWEPTTPDPDVADRSTDPTGSAEATAVAVSIPSIGVDSPLVPLGVDPLSGVLVPPESFDVAGVLAAGTVPGDVGPAIIAGHVDSRAGPGVFYRLEEMAEGELITVSLSSGPPITFRVVEVAQYPKTAFPTNDVYGPTPEAELRLITCGGDFDPTRRSYLDNIVIFAVLA